MGEEELAPVTEEAMNEGDEQDGTEAKSKTVKATLKGVKSGKKPVEHARKVRWYSSNTSVATVNQNGKIKAVGKGTCTVYAVANNGIRNSVKVTVK